MVIMQSQKGEAQKFIPLLDYLKSNGMEASFVAARSYPAAAELIELEIDNFGSLRSVS